MTTAAGSQGPLLTGAQLESAIQLRKPRVLVGTFRGVKVVLYPASQGGDATSIAAMSATAGHAYVDQVHYPDFAAFTEAVNLTIDFLASEEV